MVPSVDFRKIAKMNDVEILHFPLPNVESVSTEVDGKCFIGLDSTHKHTYTEEQTRIGHELGHCLYGGFYNRFTAFDLVERHEVRADRWYILHAIPRDTLFSLLKQGMDAWEIAEQLNTTEDYIRRAYYFYKDNPEVRA